MSSPIRIALLTCDTPMSAVREVHGDYLAIFSDLLTRSLPSDAADKATFVLDNYDVVDKMEYPADVEGYDALLITGSSKSAYADVKWIHKLVKYIKYVAEQKPVVKIVGVIPTGICFGHQIVGLALGSTCVPNNGIWEVGPSNVKLSEVGKKVFGMGKEILNIQQFHSDHVPTVPIEPFPFQCLGSTDRCANQGMVLFYDHASPPSPNHINGDDHKSLLRKIHILTTQGHPEFHASIMLRMIEVRAATGILSQEVATNSRAMNELEVLLPASHDDQRNGESVSNVSGKGGKAWVNDGPQIGEIIWGMLGLY